MARGDLSVIGPQATIPRRIAASATRFEYGEPIIQDSATITSGTSSANVFTLAAIERAQAIAAQSNGSVVIARNAADLDRCRDEDKLAMVLHLEGAEAVDPSLADLENWYGLRVRSIGPVWSRPNAFGHGVPFRFPASPDTGPGLTEAGKQLVRRCADLGIVVDVSHLNAVGFSDVAKIASAPLAASHSGCHAICPSTRNLTDNQLREIRASEGIVGVIFEPCNLRSDGANDPATPLSVLVSHIRHVADTIGIDYVGLGSDYDGATILDEIADAGKLPAIIDALREGGFDDKEIEQIAWGNWRRVLGLVMD